VQAASFINVSPTPADAANVEFATGHISSVFSSANVEAIGLADVQNLVGDAAPHTISTTQLINLSAAQLSSQQLAFGFARQHLSGPNGLAQGIQPGDSLRFRILRNGTTLVDQTFTANDDGTGTTGAQDFLSDVSYDIGVGSNIPTSTNVLLQVLFDLTSVHASNGIGTQFLLAPIAQTSSTLNPLSSHSWNAPLNWQNYVLPNGPGAAAILPFLNGSPTYSLTIDQPVYLGNLQFSGGTAYTVSPGTPGVPLTFDNAGSTASLTVLAGNQTLTTPLLLTAPGLAVSVSSGNTLTLPANITGAAALTLNGPGHVFLTPSSGTAKINSLTLNSTSLDITNNKLIIEATSLTKSSSLSSLQNFVSTHALTSSTLPANFGIAVMDNAALAVHFSTFGGLPVDTNSLLISPELLGDANADGHVDPTDLSTVLNHFGATTSNWTSGNFDHATTIDLTDLAYVLNNFGQTNPNASSQSSALGGGSPQSSVPTPEPGSLTCAFAATLLLARRRAPHSAK
jgi:hypothetical protein